MIGALRRISSGLLILLVASLILHCAAGFAADKLKRKKQLETNADGVENIDGGIIQFAAVEANTGRTVAFRFRAKDGVLYDLNSPPKLIGLADTGRKRHLKLTFNNDSPLPGTYKFERHEKVKWSGEYTVGVSKWALSLAIVDR
jgi:hypothetical protein